MARKEQEVAHDTDMAPKRRCIKTRRELVIAVRPPGEDGHQDADGGRHEDDENGANVQRHVVVLEQHRAACQLLLGTVAVRMSTVDDTLPSRPR